MKDLLFLIKDLAQVLFICFDTRAKNNQLQINGIKDKLAKIDKRFAYEEKKTEKSIKTATDKTETKALEQATTKFQGGTYINFVKDKIQEWVSD